MEEAANNLGASRVECSEPHLPFLFPAMAAAGIVAFPGVFENFKTPTLLSGWLRRAV